MNRINIKEKFNLFNEQWTPKIIAELNDSYVKIAKIKGEFTWHKHEMEDEMFFVVCGKMDMNFRDKIVELKEGEMIVVPKGVEHMPSCEEEVQIMMIEKKTTLNTGDVVNEKTKNELEWI
ncbi:MAG: cupin domain-containing protein [Eubacteriales bacterium]